MDSPVAKMLFLAAAIAAAVVVVGVMWATMNSNAPKATNEIEYDRINTQALCEAVGGNWTDSTKKCAAKTS